SICEIFYLVLFFFSSRRRHTRSYGDWSSDVCSSDLSRGCTSWPRPAADTRTARRCQFSIKHLVLVIEQLVPSASRPQGQGPLGRSEERRVGKECRSRRWPWH